MNDVIRFDIYFRGGVPEVLPSVDGRYMRFDDHEKAQARIAGLTAEVARYREALQSIINKCSDGNECDAEKVNQDCRRIARNALKEGK